MDTQELIYDMKMHQNYGRRSALDMSEDLAESIDLEEDSSYFDLLSSESDGVEYYRPGGLLVYSWPVLRLEPNIHKKRRKNTQTSTTEQKRLDTKWSEFHARLDQWLIAYIL